jgi:hypothetical protein
MDALLVGYYSGSCLMFAGKVRAGFVPHVRRQLTVKLKPLHVEQCLFMNLPDAKSSLGRRCNRGRDDGLRRGAYGTPSTWANGRVRPLGA